MVTAIAGAFGGVSGAGGESGSIYNSINAALGGFGIGSNPGDAQPAAFLNYIQVDQNYKVVDAGWTAVPSSANFAKQLISIPQLTIKEAGYIFVYLSYEDLSNNYVYFDDFKITHTPSNLVQANEYYPFGMQNENSWTRENAMGNNFLSNGSTELNATSGLFDLAFRNYDPVLGRMIQVDPMVDKYSSLSPYNYSFNNPAYWTDSNGADPLTDLVLSLFNKLQKGESVTYTGKEVQNLFGESVGAGSSPSTNPNATFDFYSQGTFFSSFLGHDIWGNSNMMSSRGNWVLKSTSVGMDAEGAPMNTEWYYAMQEQEQGNVTINRVLLYTGDEDVMGMFVSMMYSPSDDERAKYSKFGWVLTVHNNVFEKGAPDNPHNLPWHDGRPTRYGEFPYKEPDALNFAHNALVDLPGKNQTAWYLAEVSVVGFVNGAWEPLVNMNYGWNYTGGQFESFNPGIRNVSDWHIDSITNKLKW